jgi:proteasome lid subunit RPN8/RPN11
MSSPSPLKIDQVLLDQILDHARHGYPHEVCGLIGGRDGVAQSVIAIPNTSPSPRNSFVMERKAMVEAILRLEHSGQDVIAIYHSHPDSSAEPSQRDIAEATWPDAFYLIIGLSDQSDVRAWTVQHGQAEQVAYHSS